MHSLKVDNLGYDVEARELKDDFSKYGEIGDVYVPKDPDRGYVSKGYAFVR